MGNRLYLILILPLIFGCSTRDKRFDDIDFIAYHYRKVKSDNPVYEWKWQTYCTIYALIDNKGQCKMIIERFYPKPEKKYCSITLEKKLIDDVVSSSVNLDSDSDFRPQRPIIYDGPSLKIRINKGNKGKTIHFLDMYSEKGEVYVNLFQKIDSLINKNSYGMIIDTSLISLRKQSFLKYSMKSDSLLRPLPPLPTKEMSKNVKYKPPIIIE